MEKKTAIVFGGSAYNIKFSLQSQLENLIIPNNADVFVVTTRYCKRRKTHAGEIPLAHENEKWNEKNATTLKDLSKLRDDELQFIRDTFGDRLKGLYVAEEMPEYKEYIHSERVKMMNTVNRYIDKGKELGLPTPLRGNYVEEPTNGNVRCVIDQYRHVKKAYEYMEQYERENGFKYEYVMRARIDFVVPEKLCIEHYTLNHDDPNYLYVMGSFRRDEFYWADEFCWFSKRLAASKIFPSLDRMGLIDDRKYKTDFVPQDNDFRFDPETQFDLLLHELKMHIINVKIYRSARYTNGNDGYDYMNYQFRRDPIDLDYEYKLVCECKTDINEHLPILKKYAEQCEHITELGTRYGNSTVAFLSAIKGTDKKLVAYDPQWNEKIDYIKLMAKENNIDFEMKICLPLNDDRNESIIDETDLLFIDTNHNVESITEDITLHSPRCRKYMILHDTTSFFDRGQGYDNGGGGMKLFLEPFIQNNKEWKMIERYFNNNGLMIFERINK